MCWVGLGGTSKAQLYSVKRRRRRQLKKGERGEGSEKGGKGEEKEEREGFLDRVCRRMSRSHMRTPDPGISFGQMDHHRDYRLVITTTSTTSTTTPTITTPPPTQGLQVVSSYTSSNHHTHQEPPTTTGTQDLWKMQLKAFKFHF